MPAPISAALAIFLITLIVSLLGLYRSPKIIDRCLFRPYWLLRRKEYDTVVTSGFVHADLMHLIFNMVTFYFFAFPLERYIGPARFVMLYFAGLLVSHAGTWFKQRHDPEYASLGASGAISAVLFAAIVYFPHHSLFIIPIPVPIPAPLFAVGYLAYSWYAAKHPHGRINHDAHLGGALTGLAFVALTTPQAYQGLFRSFF
ncbi:MAG TPA: rhomboid family intramembrane serine protease [Steroidobacter sp.]|nr:rhomboid family intramembrane serine protease [Steroidobacteraceae bacterium]HLS83017.1 rhomboid family intramembrane serine protease [Steroidobacter sp.]